MVGIEKIRNCLVVNWNRVESRRDRSRGSIIGALGNNGLSPALQSNSLLNPTSSRFFQQSPADALDSPPTRSSARAAGSSAATWSAATPAANPQGRPCGICSCSQSQQNSYSEACGLRGFPARAGGVRPGACGRVSPRVPGASTANSSTAQIWGPGPPTRRDGYRPAAPASPPGASAGTIHDAVTSASKVTNRTGQRPAEVPKRSAR